MHNSLTTHDLHYTTLSTTIMINLNQMKMCLYVTGKDAVGDLNPDISTSTLKTERGVSRLSTYQILPRSLCWRVI